MKKLQRYDVSPAYDDSGMWVTERKDNTGQYCLSGDVSALEAENERLGDGLRNALLTCIYALDNTRTLSDIDFINRQIEAILNREHEKQP